MIHDYFGVDYIEVWKTAIQDVPEQRCCKEAKSAGAGQSPGATTRARYNWKGGRR